jgi:hypothetical protein
MTGCSQRASIMPGNSAREVVKTSDMVQNNPWEVVKAVAMAGNDGKYSEVENYLSTDCAKFCMSDIVQKAGGIRGIVDPDTRNGTVTKIKMIDQNMIGEAAEVISMFYYKDGSTRVDHTKMIKENGVWRISCP